MFRRLCILPLMSLLSASSAWAPQPAAILRTVAVEAKRRGFLASFAAASALVPGAALAKGVDAEVALIQATAGEYREIMADAVAFESGLGAEGESKRLPRQVARLTFQAVEKSAKDVNTAAGDLYAEVRPTGVGGGLARCSGISSLTGPTLTPQDYLLLISLPQDYLEVAAEYAEHAGAARDLYKLAKLGRSGENGSEEVAKAYAKRCVEEVQQASALLTVLAAAVSAP